MKFKVEMCVKVPVEISELNAKNIDIARDVAKYKIMKDIEKGFYIYDIGSTEVEITNITEIKEKL